MIRPRFTPGFLLLSLNLCTLPLVCASDASPDAIRHASWIWHAGADVHGYNQTILARRAFKIDAPRSGRIAITADCFYRLFLNGRWVNDGPARNWPEHFQFDEIDVTPYLVEGQNEIRVIARYYGVGDFHRVPQQAGLLAQLEIHTARGGSARIVTDGSWETRLAPAWLATTPKVSIQMEPAELYDARLESAGRFRHAAVLCDTLGGPWNGLAPRDVALMTRQPFALKTFLGATAVRADALDFCLPAVRLVNPGVIEANHTVSGACGMATVLTLAESRTVALQSEGFDVAVNGRRNDKNEFALPAGRHLVLALVRDVTSHDKEKSLRLWKPTGLQLRNPLQAGHENPWCFLRFPEYAFVTNDLRWIGFRDEDPRVAGIVRGYGAERDQLLSAVTNEAVFSNRLAGRAEVLPTATMFVTDAAWAFQQRRVEGSALDAVSNPAALMHDTPHATVVRPLPSGADIELLYDLGEQNCGYYDFELTAPAGVILDVFGVEYLAADGRIQHTGGNRNGLRYLTREGVNRFTSLKRRSGRYLFLTLRNLTAPVAIRHFQLIESTYPVDARGSFSCSDARLDRIWDISTRTLKLCMEDTYTDCPLYEQTHWVGDARNESLIGYTVFGAADLARRCIRLTAESLDRYPIAGCQTPSCWDTILPAWSFLWGISTWDYYWETGDREFLRQVYPSVLRNLKGAERFVDNRGLFTGAFWNLFDWTGADQGPKAVLHNSMFLVGALDAALKSAEALGDTTDTAWLQQLRARLVQGVNRMWDPAKRSYPDSIRDDGSISPSTCQHTSFLSILYDLIDPANLAAARQNLLEPPEKMIRIGSPFAMLYLYETYEKLGLEDEIIRETYRNYLPMLESGATTVWESFPSGTTGSGGFPTRSHCHAWSSAPSRFLNRIILGVKTTVPGGRALTISPRLNGLTWARGTTFTHAGPVTVAWERQGDQLKLQFSAPAGVDARVVRNDTLQGLRVTVNGEELREALP